jgi:diadenosine tetraphosphate (Ap4A) HIT family hydrolase
VLVTGAEAVECFVCRKQRERGALVPGGFVGADELVVVSHAAPWPPEAADRAVYLGYLFVEPRRHAAGLADLTDDEARAVGWWCARASRALRGASGAEHVYAKVIGDGVPHLHVHLVARYPGTPREYWQDKVTQWPGARRGLIPEITDFLGDLRAYLGTG